MLTEKINAWVQASRAPFFIATLIPLIIGGILAANDGHWNISRWIAVLLASFFVHLNTNLANDYFEYFTGADEGESIGGSRVVQEGKISLRQILIVMIVLYTLSLILGLWLLFESQAWYLIAAMIFAFFSSLFYTAPPIRYGYHSLGELFVGINMGPIMVAGTYTALSGIYSLHSLLLSLPIGLMVAMILYYQSLPDIDTDRAVGKRTLAVRLGVTKAITGFRIFIIINYLTVILLVVLGQLGPFAMLTIITVPLAIKIDSMIKSTGNWQDLHGRGGKIRLFYLLNGLILIQSIIINSY